MDSNYKLIDDKELMVALSAPQSSQREKENAFKELYDRYSGRVHAYCLKVVGDEDQADDIFQDTFIKFFQSIDSNKNQNPIGFLITIARNLCLNYKRDKKNTVQIDKFEYMAYDTQNYEDKELLDLISRSLDLLDEDQREAFVLREYTGLKYDEIAAIMDLTPINARSKVFRAKQNIKKILKPYLNDISKIK